LNFQRVVEEFQVLGSNLVDKVKELIHEGNVQRIIIKNEQGFTLVEIPVTLAAIGVIAAPVLAAVGAIAGIVTKCTLVVERREPPPAT
jgi:prepilin-type N-terminal cleavage/methylation domain-containing protein